MSDASLAALLLTNRLVPLDVEPLKAREYWTLLGQVSDVGRLFGIGVDEMIATLGITAELADRIGRLLDAATAFAIEAERLERGGITMISSFDEAYPRRLLNRLGTSAPPMLYVAGDRHLLDAGGLGVVGSRDVAPAGAEVAKAAARTAIAAGSQVISGLARGVDQLAMASALAAGGTVVGVPTEGLARVSRSAEIRSAVAAGQLCLVTPYARPMPGSPRATPWAATRSRTRWPISRSWSRAISTPAAHGAARPKPCGAASETSRCGVGTARAPATLHWSHVVRGQCIRSTSCRPVLVQRRLRPGSLGSRNSDSACADKFQVHVRKPTVARVAT